MATTGHRGSAGLGPRTRRLGLAGRALLPILSFLASIWSAPAAYGEEALSGTLLRGTGSAIEALEFRYDGRSFKVAQNRRSHDLRARGNTWWTPGRPVPPGQGQPGRIYRVETQRDGIYRAVEPQPRPALQVVPDDPPNDDAANTNTSGAGGGDGAGSGREQDGGQLPSNPPALNGDDSDLTHIALGGAGQAHYLANQGGGAAALGQIDLATSTTQRLLADLPPVVDVAQDPYTFDLLIAGGGEVVQVRLTPEVGVVSRKTLSPAGGLSGVAADGQGHLFAAEADQRILFVDYAASGRIGDPANFTASASAGSAADAAAIWDWDMADLAALFLPAAALLVSFAAGALAWRGSGARHDLRGRITYTSFAATLSALDGYLIYRVVEGGAPPQATDGINGAIAFALSLVLLFAVLVRRRRRHADRQGGRAGPTARIARSARWREDWSSVKPLVDALKKKGIDEIIRHARENPGWLDDAMARVRAEMCAPERAVRPRVAFTAALGQFARGKTRALWRGRRETPGAETVTVTHELDPTAKPAWSKVTVEAEIAPARHAGRRAAAADDEASAAERSAVTQWTRPEARPGADPDEPDVAALAQTAIEALNDQGYAADITSAIDGGLPLTGKPGFMQGTLKAMLRELVLAAKPAGGGGVPSPLALEAEYRNGELVFTAYVRAEGATPKDLIWPGLDERALKTARRAVGAAGGRVWTDQRGATKICCFTLSAAAKSAPESNPPGFAPRSRPAAVWNMMPHKDRY